MHDPHRLPPDLPIPRDDGAALHLRGKAVPPLILPCTDGRQQTLIERCAGPTVLFFYPRTGVPGEPPNTHYDGLTQWEQVPGARGCTPQNCAFRDSTDRFTALGIRLYGVSTQTSAHQAAFRERNGVRFHSLSDADLMLTRALALPTFDWPVESGGPDTLIKRMAWYVEPDATGAPRIRRVWYPVFPPDRNADGVLTWLCQRRAITVRAAADADKPFLLEYLRTLFAGPRIWSARRAYDADRLPAMIAEIDGRPAGGCIVHEHPDALEVIALFAAIPGVGVGNALMDAAEDSARTRRLPRLTLTTTNNNFPALTLYQRRGMRITAVYPGAMDECRKENPELPLVDDAGIPIRDDIELTLGLDGLNT